MLVHIKDWGAWLKIIEEYMCHLNEVTVTYVGFSQENSETSRLEWNELVGPDNHSYILQEPDWIVVDYCTMRLVYI